MKFNTICEFEEFINEKLGEDCYIHDCLTIGNATYWVYEYDYIERLKADLIKVYEEALNNNSTPL